VLTFVEITLIWHKKYTKNQSKGIIVIVSNILTHDSCHQLFLISPIPTLERLLCSLDDTE